MMRTAVILPIAMILGLVAVDGAAALSMEADHASVADVRLRAMPNPAEEDASSGPSSRVRSRVRVVDRRTGRQWSFRSSTMWTRNFEPWTGRRVVNTSVNSKTVAWVEETRHGGGTLTFTVWSRSLRPRTAQARLVARRSFSRPPRQDVECAGYEYDCPNWAADVAILNDGTIAWIVQGVGQRVIVRRPGKRLYAISERLGDTVAALGADDGRTLWWTTVGNQIELRDLLAPRRRRGCPDRSRFALRYHDARIRTYEGWFISGVFGGFSQYATMICDPQRGTEYRLPGGRGWVAGADERFALVLDFYPGEQDMGCSVSYAAVLNLRTRGLGKEASTVDTDRRPFVASVKKVWRVSALPIKHAIDSDVCDPQLDGQEAFASTRAGRVAWVVQNYGETAAPSDGDKDAEPLEVPYDMLFTIRAGRIVPLAYADQITGLAAVGERFTWEESGTPHSE